MNEDKLDEGLRKTLSEKDIRDFRSAAQKALQAHKQKKKPVQGLSDVFLIVQIAASIVLVAAIFIVWRLSSLEKDPKALAESLFEQYDPGIDSSSDSVTRTFFYSEEGFNRETAWQELDSLYQTANYQAAIEKLEQIRLADTSFAVVSRPEWTFYLAMCQLHLGQNETALGLLEQVQAPFSEKAAFFRAIALIRLGRQEESVPILESLAASASESYKEAAKRLLKELE